MSKAVTAKPATELQPMLYLNLRPFYIGGLFIILFSAPFSRGLFFQPELLVTHMITAVVFALACYDQALRREFTFQRYPLDYAAAALIAAYALSLLTAVHMRPAVGELLKVINYFMIYWIVVRAVRKEQDLDRLLAVCYAASAGVAVIGLGAAAGYINFPGAFDKGVITSTLQYKNVLAIYLTIMNLIGLALSVKAENPLLKMLYALGNFIMVVVILGAQSRGGLLLYPLGFAVFIAGLPGNYRWRAVYHTVIFLSCGLAAARLFLPLAFEGSGRQAVVYLLILAAATPLIQYAYHRIGLWLGRDEVENRTRRLVALGGLAYLGLAAAFYLFYAAAAMPTALASVFPSQVAGLVETIATGDTTLPARYEMYRDALRIAGDHLLTGAGGGAWNALYHQYQSALYWTTEAHNYFAQTLVEAGLAGLLSVLAVWGCFIRLVVRLWRRTGRKGGAWLSLWAVAVAAFTLGAHSFFDFDLSLPAMGILLWSFFGIGRAGEDILEGNEQKRQVKIDPPPGNRLILAALAATAGAALLFIPASSLYSAGKYGAMGACAIQNKNMDAAEGYYLAAHRRDPFTASYLGDLAQVYAVKAVSKDDAASRFSALACAKKASAAEPYNSSVRAAMTNVYLMMEEMDLAVRESEALLQTNPLLQGNYEILGRAYITAARYCLKKGKTGEAAEYIEKAQALPQLMKEKNDEIRAGARYYIKGDPMPPTAAVKLAAGQAQFLAGQYLESRRILKPLAGDKNVGEEAQLWLAASLTKLGEEKQAKDILDILTRREEGYAELCQELVNLPLE